jgi:NitT/TauT family transport system substrate-binding protein
MTRLVIRALVFALVAGGLIAPAAAEAIKIGIVRTLAVGPIFIAQEKGYFAAEGLQSQLVIFEAAQPIAVAAASGDIDFGVTGSSVGLYNLASQGALRIIAAGSAEEPGFKNGGFPVSNQAYAAGLQSFKDLKGHSVAVTQVGSMLHYLLGLVVEKYGIDIKSVRVLALQSNSNVSSALTGGQVDAACFPVTPTMVLIRRGDAKMLGWSGDETPGVQTNAMFTATKIANERGDMVKRFLRAYVKAAHEYHDAFTDDAGKRANGATADATMALLAKYTGQPVAEVDEAIPYVDAEARLDVKDILHQIEWFRAQGLLKSPVDGAALIDKRYAVALP